MMLREEVDIMDDLSDDLSDDEISEDEFSDDEIMDDEIMDELSGDEGIAKACKLLERNPQIRRMDVRIESILHQVSIEVVAWDDKFNRLFHISDELFEVGAWRRLGRAVRNCTFTWNEFILEKANRYADLLAVAPCINAFVAEMKYNTTIATATIELLPELSMNDLGEFIQNNKALKTLNLKSRERVSSVIPYPVSLEQSTVLSRAIQITHLETLDIQFCRFENDGSFERLMEGCSKVGELLVTCHHNWQCIAVAALLQDPANLVSKLSMKLRSLDPEQVVADISESLVGNTTLKRLNIDATWLDAGDCFDKLLCDVASIEKISNSNHMIERIFFFGQCTSSKLQQCLLLNENENKNEVTRDKILRFYFVGDFDLSPFSTMAVSVIPEVMSQIQAKDKISAIYRLLKCLPELCNVSGRVSCEHHGSIRLKRSLVRDTSV